MLQGSYSPENGFLVECRKRLRPHVWHHEHSRIIKAIGPGAMRSHLPKQSSRMMAAWLDIVNEDGSWTLIDTNRLGELVNGMPFPQRQYLDLIYFAGGIGRIRALCSILSQNNMTQKGPADLICLYLNHKAVQTDSPLLIAESGWNSTQHTGDTTGLRYATANHRKYAISDAESTCSTRLIQEEVKRQIVLPWTRVLCLFVQSISDIKAAQRLLR